MTFAALALRSLSQPQHERPPVTWEPALSGLGRHLGHLHEHSMRLRFHRNEVVFPAGEAAAHIYSVAAGCIRLCRRLADGRRSISEFMLPGDIFGLGDFHHLPYTAEAVSNATVVAYPAILFQQLREDNAMLQADLMNHFMKSLNRAQQHLFVTTCHSARERVAAFIIAMAETDLLVYGSRVDLPMGRQDIADYLGITVETVCRSLAVLKKAGLIGVPNAHQISINDIGALRALAEGRIAP